MSTPEDRLSLADAEKAEADARKAESDARKAESDSRKAESDSRKAEAEADKAAREVALSLDPELEKRKQEAEAEKAIAEAKKATADADRARVSALIPDLKDVERGETTVTTEQPLFGAVLAHRALGDAAKGVRAELEGKLGDGVILLTSDPDLASSDSLYLEVKTGLTQLITAADKLLDATKPGKAADQETGEELGAKEALGAGVAAGAAGAALGPVGAVAGALAGALPSVLSLFSANRSISTHATTADDTAALAAVAGTMSASQVLIDDFRLVPEGRVTGLLSDLLTRRSRLVELKLARDQERSQAATNRAAAEERIRELNGQLDKAREKGQGVDLILQSIKDEKATRDSASLVEKTNAVVVGVVDTVITATDTFTGKIISAPAGGKRSPLAAAALREQLRQDLDSKVSKVLLIKGAAGSIAQLLDDRPLWFKDKFTMIGSVSITYVLIDASDCLVKAAGQAAGAASLQGTIGSDFSIKSGAI